MSAVLRLLMFILAAGAAPVLTGLLPVSFLPADRRSWPWLILAGYLTSFALFEAAGLPVLLLTESGDFQLLVVLFSFLDLAVIAAGAVRCARTGGIRLPELPVREDSGAAETARREVSPPSGTGRGKPRIAAGASRGQSAAAVLRSLDPQALAFWLIFAALLAFELFMSYTNASFDGDDAYYVAQSVQTWQTGTMYFYLPYTGWTTSLDGRHAMALMPMWAAYVSTLCNTHPAIVTHSLLPLVLIPLTDVCLYCGARILTADQPRVKRQRMLPAMMIILAVLQIFGNVSIYTPETFLLMRTWQGKSLLANLILPAALILLLRYARGLRDGENRAGESCFFWIMVIILNLASGFATSLAPAMVMVLLLGAALLLSLQRRDGRLLVKTGAACIPNVLYLILLLRMTDSTLLPFLQGGRLP